MKIRKEIKMNVTLEELNALELVRNMFEDVLRECDDGDEIAGLSREEFIIITDGLREVFDRAI